NDVGRGGKWSKIGDAKSQRLRNARLHELLLPRRTRAKRLFGQRSVKGRFDLGDAVAIVGDDAGKAARQIDIAQEPDNAVEQEILHGRIKVELQLAGDTIVEIVDGAVERGHAVTVAHGREGAGDGGRRCASLVGNAHDQRGAATVDHRVAELGGD